MQIRIKVTSKIADSDDILFPWRTYQSMALHILLWSTNVTSPISCIYIDVNIDKIEDGAIVQNIQPVPSSQSSSDKDSTANLHVELENMDDEESKINGQTFLKTLVHFEGVERYLKDEDFLSQILKDTNYQVTKRNISLIGGKLMM